jgi:hypothetical protein
LTSLYLDIKKSAQEPEFISNSKICHWKETKKHHLTFLKAGIFLKTTEIVGENYDNLA